MASLETGAVVMFFYDFYGFVSPWLLYNMLYITLTDGFRLYAWAKLINIQFDSQRKRDIKALYWGIKYPMV